MPSFRGKIIDLLKQKYENPITDLQNWNHPHELMVCVILSAQATDVGVNKVTPKLFDRYKSVKDFANADIEELKNFVKTINFYIVKSKRIIDANKYLLEHFSGKMPKEIKDLIKIPGLGRKSANVILNECFGISEGIVVDTHMTRVTNRLGLQPYDNQKNAVKIEEELMKKLPKNQWQFFSASIVLHGRYVCKAKKPDCENCTLNKVCPSAFKL